MFSHLNLKFEANISKETRREHAALIVHTNAEEEENEIFQRNSIFRL